MSDVCRLLVLSRVQTCLFHQKTVRICLWVLDVCGFLTGHLIGESVSRRQVLVLNSITKKPKRLIQIITFSAGEWKMFDSQRGEEERDPGGRNDIKPGIVTDSRRPQRMTFIQNLWRYKKTCWWNLYIQLLRPFLCLNFNLSLEPTYRIIGWSVNWQSDSTYFEQSRSNWIDFQHQRWSSSYNIPFTLLNSKMVQLLKDKKVRAKILSFF